MKAPHTFRNIVLAGGERKGKSSQSSVGPLIMDIKDDLFRDCKAADSS